MTTQTRRFATLTAATMLFLLMFAAVPTWAQTLTVVLWQIPEGNVVPQQVIDAFEKEHPGVTIDLISGSSTGYEERINVMIAAGAAPDILAISDFSITDYMNRRLIQPMDLAAAGFNDMDEVIDAYLPGALDAFIHDGQLWALPQEWNTLLLYYNRRLFDEAGLSMPVWGEFDKDLFIDAATKTTSKAADGTLQRVGMSSSWWHDQLAASEWGAHLESRGAALFGPSGELTLNTPGARDAYEFLQDLVQQRRIAVDQLDALRFTDQLVAMNFTGAWVAKNYQQLGIDFGLVPWPLGPEVVIPAYSWGWVISSQSQHAELASKFMRYVLMDRAEQIAEHTGFNLPLREALYYPMYADRPEMTAFFQSAEQARYFPPTPNFKDVATGLRQLMWSATGPGQGIISFSQAVAAVEPRLRDIFTDK